MAPFMVKALPRWIHAASPMLQSVKSSVDIGVLTLSVAAMNTESFSDRNCPAKLMAFAPVEPNKSCGGHTTAVSTILDTNIHTHTQHTHTRRQHSVGELT